MKNALKNVNILIVDDDDEWVTPFRENLETITPMDLVGKEYESFQITHVLNQADADAAVLQAGPSGYDLVLLDLRYPLDSNSLIDDDEHGGFQGMHWLPDLRRFQPTATIVILTSFAGAAHLQHVVRAIRDFDANDFIPKTTPFDLIVARIRLAAENARSMRTLWMLEEEFRSLVRTRATRTYAEDIAALLSQTKAALYRTAQRIESGDLGAIDAAPEAIKSESRFLMKEFEKLTELLDEGQESRREIDVAALTRQMLLLYEREIERAQARAVGPDESEQTKLVTFEGDLKLTLHEVITNAVNSLEKSTRTPPRERELDVSVRKVDGNAVIRILDNGDGFSDDAMAHMFERGFSSKNGNHRGMGLHIARRMMNQIGGKIEARNRPEGGAEIEILVRNLAI